MSGLGPLIDWLVVEWRKYALREVFAIGPKEMFPTRAAPTTEEKK